MHDQHSEPQTIWLRFYMITDRVSSFEIRTFLFCYQSLILIYYAIQCGERFVSIKADESFIYINNLRIYLNADHPLTSPISRDLQQFTKVNGMLDSAFKIRCKSSLFCVHIFENCSNYIKKLYQNKLKFMRSTAIQVLYLNIF